jgi:hypothetical protein
MGESTEEIRNFDSRKAGHNYFDISSKGSFACNILGLDYKGNELSFLIVCVGDSNAIRNARRNIYT